MLPQLWELNLHDNSIGGDGLTALAASRAAQRLLELDLELDCGNPGAWGPHLPVDVVDQTSFPSLDAMFLGVVDEYHDARYSCGVPVHLRNGATRPELAAYLSHLDMMEELNDSEEGREGANNDFRTDRAERHAKLVDQSREFADRMIRGDIGWPPS